MSAVLQPVSGSTTTEPNKAPQAVKQPASFSVSKRHQKMYKQWFLKVFPPLVGMGFLIGVWAILTQNASAFPSPIATFNEAVRLFSDPFYQNGPNDQGIGWNVLSSLKRVGMGFGLAALVGIPLGFIIGRFDFANRMFAPLIALFKPVSPLAWLPLGLLMFKAANPAAIWAIFICSIWPMIINTAVCSAYLQII